MLAATLVLMACQPPPPPALERLALPDDLRSCAHPAAVPPALPKVVGPAALRQAYDAELAARQADQLAAVECGRKLVEVVLRVDGFNVVHASR